MVLTGIGEIGVTVGNRKVKLRPSLYAVSKLGEPEHIVEIFASVMSDYPYSNQFENALAVIFCCCDDDVSDIFGYYENMDGKIVYVPGYAPKEHILPLARCLMKHGVVGDLPPLPKKDGEQEYKKGFDARELAAVAIAHLGSSSNEAWNMTMTELIGALRAKFPPIEDPRPGNSRAPSLKEHEATMEWYEKVEAKRKKRSGAH